MTVTINGTTGISGVDGSAATPAIQGSDTNTGIYFGSDLIYASTGGVNRMTIDASGRMFRPYQTMFGLYKSAAISSSGTFTTYAAISGFSASNIGSSFNTTTGVFTAPVTGTYLFGMQFSRESNTTGRDIMQFRINGGTGLFEALEVYGPYQDVGNCVIVPLAANDTISLYYSTVSAGSADAFFSGYLLG